MLRSASVLRVLVFHRFEIPISIAVRWGPTVLPNIEVSDEPGPNANTSLRQHVTNEESQVGTFGHELEHGHINYLHLGPTAHVESE